MTSKAGLARAGRLIALMGPPVVVVALWQRLAGNDQVIAVVLGGVGTRLGTAPTVPESA